MFSTFKSTLDADNRGVLEIGPNQVLFQTVIVVVPLLIMLGAYFFAGRGPGGMPWFLVAGPIGVAVFGFFVYGWLSKRTRVRVTIDSNAGNVIVQAANQQSEIALVDIERAEFSHRERAEDHSSTSNGDDTTTLHFGGNIESRLEFVLKDGGHVSAGNYQTFYSSNDQAKMVAAINSALG